MTLVNKLVISSAQTQVKRQMKTGELAAAFGLSRDAINNWMRRPEFEKFFSQEALGRAGTPQRQYNESDVLVMNTIRWLRYEQNVTDWQEIAQRLDAGERFEHFPSQSSIAADPRTIPYQQAEQSAKAMATLAERDAALARVEQLEMEIERLRDKHETTIERLLREIAELRYTIGRLEADRGTKE